MGSLMLRYVCDSGQKEEGGAEKSTGRDEVLSLHYTYLEMCLYSNPRQSFSF